MAAIKMALLTIQDVVDMSIAVGYSSLLASTWQYK